MKRHKRTLAPGGDVNVFPNPAGATTSVAYSLSSMVNVTVELTDLLGRIIQQNNLGEHAAGEYQYQMNLAGVSSGMYLVSLRINDEVVSRKIFKY